MSLARGEAFQAYSAQIPRYRKLHADQLFVGDTAIAAPTLLDATALGAKRDGSEDVAALIQAVADSASRAVAITFPPGLYKFDAPLDISDRPIRLEGVVGANTSTRGVAINAPNGFLRLENADGSQIRNLYVTGGGSGTEQIFIGRNASGDGTFQTIFENMRMVNGYRAVVIQGANTIRFMNVSTSSFDGPEVIKCNGVSDEMRADPIEFVMCSISPGETPDTDCIVFDGLGGSAKFYSCYIGTGRRGLVVQNTIGQNTGSFFYVIGGGFENNLKEAIYLDAGNQFNGAGFYLSTDGDGSGVYIGPNFGDAEFAGVRTRGSGRDGFRIGGKGVRISGSAIINNARLSWDLAAVTVSATANNGSGLVRVTTAAAHNYATGDKIQPSGVQDLSSSTFYVVTVIDATHFDVVGSTFTAAGSAGTVTRVDGAISGVANNGSGLIRVTFAKPHNYITDDMARIASVGGVTAANGDWPVTVISSTAVDLQGSAFSGTYTANTGIGRRLGYGVRILPTASDVVISGSKMGLGASGVNRQVAGVLNQAPDTLVIGCNLNGNSEATLVDLSKSRLARFVENVGPEQYDFAITLSIANTVANGDYRPTQAPLWLMGRKFRIYKVIRKTSAGTCDVKLRRFNGTATVDVSGSANAGASVTLAGTSALASPYDVDASAATEWQPRISVQNASGDCANLDVEIRGQWIA